MPGRRAIEVVEVPAADTHELRRRVLRNGDPASNVDFPEDAADGAFHLAARAEDGTVVGVASFSPSETPYRVGQRCFQLRGMAVDEAVQGAGVGRALLDAAVERLLERDVDVLWANGRDSALGFYERWGMDVVGDGFINERGIPHHVVIRDLKET